MNVEKILEINEFLSKGYSLNKLDKDGVLGCARKTFGTNAKKLGYVYDSNVKQFIKVTNVTPNTSSVTKETKSVTKESETKKKNAKKTEFNEDKAKELEERIKILEDIVLQNNIPVTSNDFIIDTKFKKDIITRSIKVSKTAMDIFNLLAESKFAMYTKQDLLSKALIEFYEKYK